MKDVLKQRLVGAFVLAAIGVIFLPSFFKEQRGYEVDTATQIPPRPTLPQVTFDAPTPSETVTPAPDPETMFLPSDDEPEGATEIAQNHDPASEVAVVKKSEEPDESSSLESRPKKESSSPDTVPEMPLNEKGIPDAWVVQVASLGSKDAANKLRDELQNEGYKAYVRTATSAGVSVTRVFIGPKLNKSEAEAIKSKIDTRLKVNSLVRRFQP